MTGLRIALVGKAAYGRISVSNWLMRHHKFKVVRLDDGIQKFVRYMYYYQPHERVRWEQRLQLYDATYKVDPNIHIGYVLRRLHNTAPETDVVVPDARYVEEIQRLIDLGFIVIRVTEGPGYRPQRMAGMKHAATGTVKLQEVYGRADDRYPVHYSVENVGLEKLRKSIDRIIDIERGKNRAPVQKEGRPETDQDT